ncbi:forkhead box protein H1-like isoform X1 [Anneissia japonica]|uniref:forkhead box protein H1-like isoform X1 n=1 Tax=Anneissia japonica TaxID=1529436 RepID=UPI0014259DFD|nr:forkhead box protein H1-like isoform X1 [Anneissia japonica]
MSDQERVSPVFLNLACATDSDRASPVSTTSSSNGSETSSNASSSNRRGKGKLRPDYKRRIKLPYSYVEMITMAIKSSSSDKLTLRDITNFMQDKFLCFRGEYVGWKNSVRHNLSTSKCFTKVLRDSSRPYGKDNFWIMNAECEHCKNKCENDVVSKRILSNHAPISDSIPPVSPASSESSTDPAADNQMKLLNHPTTKMSSCQRMVHDTNTAAPEEHYDNRYYDQYSYTAHHGSRRHHRYHPYTSPHSNNWQQKRHPVARQGTNSVDDLETIEDLYVPSHDIDFSMMYNNSKTLVKEQPECHVPYSTYYPTGFQGYETPYYYPYMDFRLPTPYQLPQDHYDWQRAPSVDNRVNHHPNPYDFVQQVCDVPSFPSSPSSIHSSDSSSSDSAM